MTFGPTIYLILWLRMFKVGSLSMGSIIIGHLKKTSFD